MSSIRLPVVDQIFGHNKAPVETVLAADFADLIKDVAAVIAAANEAPTAIKNDADLASLGQCILDLKAVSKRVDGQRKEEVDPALAAQRSINAFFGEHIDALGAAAKRLQAAADDYTRRKEAEARAEAQRKAEEARQREEEARRKAEEAASASTAARAEGRAEQHASAAERAEDAASGKASDLVRTKVGGMTASATTKWDFRIKDSEALRSTLGALGPYFTDDAIEKAVRSLVRVRKGGASLSGVEVFEDTKATFRK